MQNRIPLTLLLIGDEANLVVLEASPVEDNRNTQRIALVIQHGEVMDRERLLAGASTNPP